MKYSIAKYSIVLVSLVVFSGCGLLTGKKKGPALEETPPYYGYSGSYASVPMDHPKLQREPLPGKKNLSLGSELEKLEQDAEDYVADEKRRQEIEEDRTEKKEKFFSWFKSGKKTSGMSNDAKKINERLDQRDAGKYVYNDSGKNSASKETEKQSGLKNWLGSGEKTTGMSSEAKAINERLEASRIDSAPQR